MADELANKFFVYNTVKYLIPPVFIGGLFAINYLRDKGLNINNKFGGIMSEKKKLTCEICGRDDLKSAWGKEKHEKACRKKEEARIQAEIKAKTLRNIQDVNEFTDNKLPDGYKPKPCELPKEYTKIPVVDDTRKNILLGEHENRYNGSIDIHLEPDMGNIDELLSRKPSKTEDTEFICAYLETCMKPEIVELIFNNL